MLRSASFVAASLLLIAAAGLFFRSSRAQAQDQTQALINTALDKQVQLNIDSVLPQAMSAIAEKTGVRVEAGPEVYDLLPWGQDTKIKAKIQNQTLRQALTGITQKLGLTFVLGDQSVQLEPMPALRRLARRSTVEELNALDTLASTPLNPSATKLPLKDLLDSVDGKLEAIKSPYAVANRSADGGVAQSISVSIARNATLMEALDEVVRQTGATWYPWGKTIVVISKPDEVRRQLAKAISVRYNGVPLEQVLLELRQRAGVRFEYEPAAIQQVPPEARTIRLVLDNATIQDALDNISGVTGLDYQIRDDGVYFSTQATRTVARDRVVIMIPLGSGAQLVVPQSQIPTDLREYISSKTQEEFRKLRDQMKEEGFKPSTQPATHPAGPQDERL
jgi:hypothetical protein